MGVRQIISFAQSHVIPHGIEGHLIKLEGHGGKHGKPKTVF